MATAVWRSCMRKCLPSISRNCLSTSSLSNSRPFHLKGIFKKSSQITPQSVQSLVPVIDHVAENAANQNQKKVYSESSRVDEPLKEKFIPLTRHELLKSLSKEYKHFNPTEIKQMQQLAFSLDAYFSRRFYMQLEEMKLLYDIMDPDKDTIQTKDASMKEVLDNEYWFLQKIEMLLHKANYYKMQRSEILTLLKSHDVTEGVRVSVDPLKYSTLRIWTRGLTSSNLGTIERLKRRIKLVLSKHKESSVLKYYTRVFIAVRSKSSKKLHLKVFKDVPCSEVEYLVPDGKIEMTSFDKGFLMSSMLLGSFAVCLKLLTVAANLKLDYGLIVLGIAGVIGARGWIGYKNKRNKYLANLSRTLYFKTVANNRSVLTLLIDRAEDEEFKESLLAYMFLLSPPNRRGIPGSAYTPESPKYHTKESLQVQVQTWLLDTYGFSQVSFDVDDALMKLDQIGLLVRHADDTFTVVPINIALETLPSDSMYVAAVSQSLMGFDSETIVQTTNSDTHATLFRMAIK